MNAIPATAAPPSAAESHPINETNHANGTNANAAAINSTMPNSPASSPSSTSSTPFDLRLVLLNSLVGGVIGSGGSSIQSARATSGAHLSVLQPTTRQVHDRVMHIKGNKQQVAHATMIITQLLIDAARRREERPIDTAEMRILVHKSSVGAIIGRGGSTIKEMQAETGARVQVSNEVMPNSTEKTVTLIGTPHQIHACVSRIISLLEANPLKPGVKFFPYVPGSSMYAAVPTPFAAAPNHNLNAIPYAQGQPMHMYATQMNAFQGGMRGAAPAGVLSSQKIAIPTICAGSVIGKGGSVIRELRHASGASISIADAEENNPQERIVTITANNVMAINHAVFMIQKIVEEQPNQINANAQQQQQQPQQLQPNGQAAQHQQQQVEMY